MPTRLERARIAAAAILDESPDRVRVSVAGRGRGGGRPRKLTDDQIRQALAASGGVIRAAARVLGISESAVRARKKAMLDAELEKK